jgi:DNA polymerase-3 subunit delta
MNVTGARVETFLRKPDPKVACVLVFGPDQGLVRERAEALGRTAVADLADPFRVVELTGAALRADPARLADEAAALSFTGGRRLVRVRDAGDVVAGIFESFLESADGGALVVVEAGDLPKRSSLRRVFEAADNAAAIACYPDDERALRAVVAETLKGAGLTITPEAAAVLIERLGGDRAQTRRELEKLVLYVQGRETVAVDDVQAAVGDSVAASLEAVVFAAADGDPAALDRALTRAFLEGVSPVAVLRAMARHLERLHLAQAFAAAGASPDQAMAKLRPPVIFKVADRFRRQMAAWRPDRLATALDIVITGELDCKTTGLPAEAVAARALMRLAHAARGGRSKSSKQ